MENQKKHNQENSHSSAQRFEEKSSSMPSLAPPPMQLKAEGNRPRGEMPKPRTKPRTRPVFKPPGNTHSVEKEGGKTAFSPGPLPAPVQVKMENSFKADFSKVAFKTNSAEAKSMGAKAFAQGESVHFAPGAFSPNTKSGQELIGHELSHVVQQRKGAVPKVPGVNANPELEREADEKGAKAARGLEVSGPGKVIRGAGIPNSPQPIQGKFLSGKKLLNGWGKAKDGPDGEKNGQSGGGLAGFFGKGREMLKDGAGRAHDLLGNGRTSLDAGREGLLEKSKGWVSGLGDKVEAGVDKVTDIGEGKGQALLHKVIGKASGVAENLVSKIPVGEGQKEALVETIHATSGNLAEQGSSFLSQTNNSLDEQAGAYIDQGEGLAGSTLEKANEFAENKTGMLHEKGDQTIESLAEKGNSGVNKVEAAVAGVKDKLLGGNSGLSKIFKKKGG